MRGVVYGNETAQGKEWMPVAQSDAISAAWWRELSNGACILDYAVGDRTVSMAAEFVRPCDIGAGTLRFRIFPANATTMADAPVEVRLLTILGGSSCIVALRVRSWAAESLVVDATPLSLARRPLRRVPRTPYRLGPCTAVVHSAVRQWRGLVEFWVRDVSAQGVGFAVLAAHADRVDVGDYLRAPVTLPDGQRSWIDGEVVWLMSDGRGGLLTRRAPDWRADAEAPTSLAIM